MHNLFFFFRKKWQWTVVYQLLGSFYEKDGTKRGKSRYNHQTGFRRKMKQYKKTTNHDIAVIFYQSTKKRETVRYSTKKVLDRVIEKFSVSTQTDDAVNALSTALVVSIIIGINIYNTYVNPNESQTSTPLKRRKKLNKNSMSKIISSFFL